MPKSPITPLGLNHLVLNVRDIEASHEFYTELIGLKLVGKLRKTVSRPNPPRMRFNSGQKDGKYNHHDLALVENKNLPPKIDTTTPAINHLAITLPDRKAWLRQLAFLQEKGVKFGSRVEHGMTHSLYIKDPDGYGVELLYELPRDVWEEDIDGALNYSKSLPTEGRQALVDDFDNVPIFRTAHD